MQKTPSHQTYIVLSIKNKQLNETQLNYFLVYVFFIPYFYDQFFWSNSLQIKYNKVNIKRVIAKKLHDLICDCSVF